MRRRMLMEQTPPKPVGALYWYGDECVDVTGGWIDALAISGYIQKQQQQIVINYNNNTGKTGNLLTQNIINKGNYTTLKALVKISAKRNAIFGFVKPTQDINTWPEPSVNINSNIDYGVAEIPISNEQFRPAVRPIYYSSQIHKIYIKAIWLE